MSTLKELLNKHCPDGVEYKTLEDVCIIYTGEQLNRKNMIKEGYPVINGGIQASGYTNNFNEYEETITISQGGASAGFVNFMLEKFWAGAHCYIIKPNTDKLINKYLFFVLKNIEIHIMELKNGAGIPGINKNKITKIKIPLPPIEVQKEIVRILDTFTKYQDLLNRELELRKKQYEYYRDKLLTFNDDVEWKKLPEIADTFIGLVTTMTKNYSASGVPLIFNSSIKENKFVFNKRVYLNETFAKKNEQKRHKTGDIISVHTGDVGTSAIIDEKLDGSIGFATIVTRIKDNSKVYNKYICYFLNSRKAKSQISSLIKGDRDNLNLKDFNKIIVPIPPLEEQERIVNILDKFDALCNDITRGLPAEIELRKKQYEYYRDKLLTFKEKKK